MNLVANEIHFVMSCLCQKGVEHWLQEGIRGRINLAKYLQYNTYYILDEPRLQLTGADPGRGGMGGPCPPFGTEPV